MSFSIVKLIPFLTTVVGSWMKNKDHDNRIKKFDNTAEKINTIENLIVRLEKKLKETREDLRELQHQVILSRIINIVLSCVIIIGMFLIYYK